MYDELLQQLLTQEEELQLPYFNQQLAWVLGCLIKSGAEKINAAVSFEIYAFEQTILSYAMPGTVKDQQDWLRRKRQSVLRFGHCSYYLGQYNASKNRDFETQSHIDPKEYCGHGGSFPIRLKNTGLIGAVSVSGLPQEVDHKLAVDALRELIASL
jgi:uncharacterized protein (UPF0303 family)